jgi:protein gp37
MGANSKIEWTDHTFNPWTGCEKVSPACAGCYAEAWAKRAGHPELWKGKRRRTTEAYWRQPLKWDRVAAAAGRRARVFCASLADVFDNVVPASWRSDLFRLIRNTPHLDWLLLTKRIGNAARMIEQAMRDGGVGDHFRPDIPWQNVWLGATICNQEEAERDIPKLLATPARVRFLSIEPMLGPIDLRRFLEPLCYAGSIPVPGGGRMCPRCQGHRSRGGCLQVDWVIVGGESGPGARPMHPDWARSLRDQCAAAGVPFLFKQWGEWAPRGPEEMGYPVVDGVPRMRLTELGENGSDLGAEGESHVWMNRAGKARAGRALDGVTHDGFPVSAA